MSIYLVTNDSDMIEKAEKNLSVFYEGELYKVNYGEIGLLVTKKKKRDPIIKTFSDGIVFIEGTIFDSECWNVDVLNRYSTQSAFIDEFNNKKKHFFGHYTIVSISKDGVEVFSDPIGIINTYYNVTKDTEWLVSNDSFLIAKLCGIRRFSKQAAWEYILHETNIGDETIFESIRRLGLGKKITISDKFSITQMHEYIVEKLNEKEYFERISEYFSCLKKYKGDLIADVSAGYDTRTVIASAIGAGVDITCGYTSDNQMDDGVDTEISKLIVNRCSNGGMPLVVADRTNVNDNELTRLLVLHGTSVMRSCVKSIALSYVFKDKFRHGDLALSGYGGEIIRAKYNKFKNLDDFAKGYYKNIVAKENGLENYYSNVKQKLGIYPKPVNMEEDMLANWFYAVDKMRIWGSGLVQMSNIMGESLHPFMDWYLISAVLGFAPEELYNGKMQNSIITHFSGELFADIPVNRHKKVFFLRHCWNMAVPYMNVIMQSIVFKIMRILKISGTAHISKDIKEQLGIRFIGNSKYMYERILALEIIERYLVED